MILRCSLTSRWQWPFIIVSVEENGQDYHNTRLNGFSGGSIPPVAFSTKIYITTNKLRWRSYYDEVESKNRDNEYRRTGIG